MWDVLRGALTRHMLGLFVGITLVPLLIFGVISSVMRVQSQDRAVYKLEADLTAKAADQILAQARNKAGYMAQVLSPRTAVAVLLAEHGQRLYEAGRDSTDRSTAEATAAMAWSISQDTAVRAAFIALQGYPALVMPSHTGQLDHVGLFADWAPENPPASGQPTAVAWHLTYTGQGALLVLASPVWSGNHAVGIAGLELWLDRVIEEVPHESLVGRSSLLLVSADARFLALQSWRYDSFRWSRLPPLALKAGRLLTEFLPSDAAQALDAEPFKEQLAQRAGVVLPVDLEDQSAFMAFHPVSDIPLIAVLVVPFAEVRNLAQSYGAPLRVTMLPVIIEFLVVAVALVFAVSLSAVLTLRQIAQPIRALSDGAHAIMLGRFKHRVPQAGPDELQGLASSFNRMAEAVGKAQGELEGKQAELARALAARQTQFEIINQVAALANHRTELSDKLTTVLRVVCPALGVDDGAVALLKSDGSLVWIAQFVGNQSGPLRVPLARQQEVHVRRALAGNGHTPYGEIAHITTASDGWCAAAPFELRGADRGAIVIAGSDPEPSDDVLAFLKALAMHVAMLVDNASLQSELRYVVLSEERRRMARELHDSVTQTVFTLSLAAEGLKASLEEPRPEVSQALDYLSAQAARARQEMRGLINELRPIDLQNEGLDQAIRFHAASLQRATGLQVQTRIDGNVSRLSSLVQHNMNRIMQEALSNVMRHARASSICIELVVGVSQAELRVTDDGRGFASAVTDAEQMGSLGLISMRERAEAMGGTLTVESAAGHGTTVRVQAPLLVPAREASDG